MNTGFKEGK